MRLIEQIAAALAGIIARRRGGQNAEARLEIETTCLQTCGLPIETVKNLPPDALAAQLRTSGANRTPRAVMLAELLIQDAEIFEEQGAPHQALPGFLQAFCLLFDSIEVLSTEEQAIYRPKLATLAARLGYLPPNPYVTEKLRLFQTSHTACSQPPAP